MTVSFTGERNRITRRKPPTWTGTLESVVLPTTPSLISDRDERKLIEYIKMMEKCGFVLTKKEIIDLKLYLTL
jgi:hypothetical protein